MNNTELDYKSIAEHCVHFAKGGQWIIMKNDLISRQAAIYALQGRK